MVRRVDLFCGEVFLEAPEDILQRLKLKRGPNDEVIYRVAENAPNDVLTSCPKTGALCQCAPYRLACEQARPVEADIGW
jgi:hypothetical protein